MIDLGKVLIFLGLFLIVGGLVVLMIGKIPGIGRLPGDIIIKKENFTLYFPLTTSVLISVVLSLIVFLLHKR